MTRTRRAAVAAAFGYGQYALAIVGGFVVIPLTLRYVGARYYGLWLASGDLLAYASMVDLGVLSVMPWMLAELDGRRDRDAMRALLVNGLFVGVVVGVGYGVMAALLWNALPSMLHLSAADRAAVGPPLAMIVLATTIGYPMRVFSAVISGLQDVWFNGLLGVVQSVVSVAITVLLLINGRGLYALAAASAASSLVIVGLSLVRTMTIAPDLLRAWPMPTFGGVRDLLANGAGVWVGAFGWQLLAASNNLVLTYIGHPEWVPVYACTAKLAVMSTQLAWVLPDSGLVGLAQLYGEQRVASRVKPIVVAMMRLHLLLAGGAACGLLAFNPAFVTRWVGDAFFGGLTLNALLAIGVVLYSVVHGLIAAASVLGNRMQVGVVSLANGLLQVGSAVLLGRWWGLPGIAAAGLITGAATALPAGIVLLRPTTGLTIRSLLADVGGPWTARAAPFAIVGLLSGVLYQTLGLAACTVISVGLGTAYLWSMRPIYQTLPLDPHWSRWLVSLRLVSPMTTPIAPAGQTS